MLRHTHTAYFIFIAFKQRDSSPVLQLTLPQAPQVWGCSSTLVRTRYTYWTECGPLRGPNLPATQCPKDDKGGGDNCQKRGGTAAGIWTWTPTLIAEVKNECSCNSHPYMSSCCVHRQHYISLYRRWTVNKTTWQPHYTRYTVQYPLRFRCTVGSLPYFPPNLQGKLSYTC